ncbi:hypothetical protein ACFXPZ_27585 [Streptomyces sp. NPDC059101]|uniref:hypothetical protein n=1 Tax=unclassified Streptomyces TaxID=2593676 RepID=UPI0036C913AC
MRIRPGRSRTDIGRSGQGRRDRAAGEPLPRLVALGGPAAAIPAELAAHRSALTDLLDDLAGADGPAEVAFLACRALTRTAQLALLPRRHWQGSGRRLLRELHRSRREQVRTGRCVAGCHCSPSCAVPGRRAGGYAHGMVTARSPFGMRRTRRSAGPVGLWCLFAVLLAVALTHGLSAESGVGHLSSSFAGSDVQPSAGERPAAEAQHASVVDRGQGRQEQPDSHPTGACLSGQPPQGAGVHAPDQAPLDRCALPPTTRLGTALDGCGPHSALPSDGSAPRSAVLLI